MDAQNTRGRCHQTAQGGPGLRHQSAHARHAAGKHLVRSKGIHFHFHFNFTRNMILLERCNCVHDTSAWAYLMLQCKYITWEGGREG